MKTEFGMMGLSFWEAPARMEIRRGLTLICPLNSPIGHRFDPALPALGAWDGIDMVPGRGAWVVRIELTGDTAGMAYRAYPVMTPEEHIALA